MGKFRPKMYYQDIFHINYSLLKAKGIKMLIFDIDNTTVKVNDKLPSIEIKNLLKKLKDNFTVALASNNKSVRVKEIGKFLGVHAFYSVLKPTKKLKRLLHHKQYNIKMEEIAIIGDQIVTDIFMGNRLNMLTILVDPLEEQDLKVTYFNRFLEKRIMKRIKFVRGEYYEEK